MKNILRNYTTLPWCRRIYYALTIHFITVKGDARQKIHNLRIVKKI